MSVPIEQVKQLREQIGASIMDCKKALEDARGDQAKAMALLEARSKTIATKKQGRILGAGLVHSYIHGNQRVGVLLELWCETDFVAKNDKFQQLAHDLALHIAALRPEYLSRADVPEAYVKSQTKLFIEETAKEKKPAAVKKKIAEGKLEKFLSERFLFSQPFVKDPSKTVAALLEQYTATIGERLAVGRFVRFEV